MGADSRTDKVDLWIELRERIARAIWAKRPDCQGKPWPISSAEDHRAYPHNPIAAVDLCFIYADTAISVFNENTTKDATP